MLFNMGRLQLQLLAAELACVHTACPLAAVHSTRTAAPSLTSNQGNSLVMYVTSM
jgi:hypothetical protein